MKIIISKIVLLLVVSCITVSQTHSQVLYTSVNDTAIECYISDFINENGMIYINFKPIKIFTGLSAVIEAKKDRNADYTVATLSNDTGWYVPDDYYIAEREKSKFKLPISEKVNVFIYIYEKKKEISLNEFMIDSSLYKIQLYDKYTYEKKEDLDYYPYDIVIEKGEVTIIHQHLTP